MPHEPTKHRVLLADDHRIVLDGLTSLLQQAFEVVATVANGMELVSTALRLRPEVVVSDVSMPLLNGIEALRQVKEQAPNIKWVMLSMHADVTYVSRALQAGAQGYVVKDSAADELIEAVHSVLNNKTYISPSARAPSLNQLLNTSTRHVKHVLELTPRQREVLQLLAEGRSAKEIGAILGISARTVETHKYQMMETLGLKTSAQLVQYAIKNGWV
jgi:DNA-binding NarL/FixJ family response regulator